MLEDEFSFQEKPLRKEKNCGIISEKTQSSSADCFSILERTLYDEN